jgi:hypothetical protein
MSTTRTVGHEFDLLELAFREGGPDAVFERLVRTAREEQGPRDLFAIRVMQVRHRLGLPLIETEKVLDLDDERRLIYETAFRDAARETGEMFLANGDIVNAWPYFKAIGEHAPVAAAIDVATGSENLDRLIEIAFREGVNPRKGFELLLEHHGICSAITWYGSSPDFSGRMECLRLLIRTLYSQLAASLRETVAATEGVAQPAAGVSELIAGRDWLFEGMSSYVDSTHLVSVLRFAPELEDPEMLRMVCEMAEYGRRLSPMFHFRGDPPFEDVYLDHAVFLKALLGEETDAAVEHFRGKLASAGEAAAPVLIDLLVRLGRQDEAIRVSEEYLPDASLQLCQAAGDYATLSRLARQRADPLGFAAAVIQSSPTRESACIAPDPA